MVDLIRTLVYVSGDLFDRGAIVRVVDANPPERAWARGRSRGVVYQSHWAFSSLR